MIEARAIRSTAWVHILVLSMGSNALGLDDSARQIRARPLVWSTYGLQGSAGIRIGILDSGVDSTHLDFRGRIVGWYDATASPSPTPIDWDGHGTVVTGIVAGTGAKYPGAVSSITLTANQYIPPPIDVPLKIPSGGPVTLDMVWQGGGNAALALGPPAMMSLCSTTGPSPRVLNCSVTTPGLYLVHITDAGGAFRNPFTLLITQPYQSPGDGFGLFRGIAAQCQIVGIRAWTGSDVGDTLQVQKALRWVAANNQALAIKVVNMSGGASCSTPIPTLRATADSVALAGTVLVLSAQNDFNDSCVIGDPARSAEAITVGAINDLGALAYYSTAGAVGSNPLKPDIVAPGGSYKDDGSRGTLIVSTEPNSFDLGIPSGDRNRDDYSAGSIGTSVAAPHVTGAAALVIQAREQRGLTWHYSQQDVLDVKMILLMTATETNKPSDDGADNPSLDRGGKDRFEGYGQLNVDAAVEAVRNSSGNTLAASVSFGPGVFDRRCWATRLTVGSERWIVLDAPATADLDLYVYAVQPVSLSVDGDPQILRRSIRAGLGVDELVNLYGLTGEIYVVVKLVAGSGLATIGTATTSGTANAPASPIRIDVDRNPARGSVFLRWSLETAGKATVVIYDSKGRVIRQLVDGISSAGDHVTSWDGVDDRGGTVPTGSYFAQLEAGSQKRTTRVLWFRP